MMISCESLKNEDAQIEKIAYDTAGIEASEYMFHSGADLNVNDMHTLHVKDSGGKLSHGNNNDLIRESQERDVDFTLEDEKHDEHEYFTDSKIVYEDKIDEILCDNLVLKQLTNVDNPKYQGNTVFHDEEGEHGLESLNVKSFDDLSKLEQSVEEVAMEKQAFDELRSVIRERRGLKSGAWFTKNEDIFAGIESAKKQQMITSDFETAIRRYLDVGEMIEIVENYESLFKQKYKEFVDKKITEKELNNHLSDFGLYSVALLLLKSVLDTKGEDGTLRYVGNDERHGKKFLSLGSAEIILKKVNKVIYTAENLLERNEGINIGAPTLATPYNIINNRDVIKGFDKLIGGRIEASDYSKELRPELKEKLVPGSVLWTWMNSSKLCNGNFFKNLFNKDSSIFSVFNNIGYLRDEYLKIIEKIESIKNHVNADHNRLNIEIEELLSNYKMDENFKDIHKKGGEALCALREILNITKMYQVAGRTNKTMGREFVGKWVQSDNLKRITIEQAKELEAMVDFLASLHVYIESSGKLHSDLKHSQTIRGDSEYWCYESLEQQLRRETENRAATTKILAQGLVVITLITGMIPLVGPAANLALFALKLGIVGGILSV